MFALKKMRHYIWKYFISSSTIWLWYFLDAAKEKIDSVVYCEYIRTSVQFSCQVMSNSFRPHELQHARPSCPSPTPRVYTNPCPSSWWCHPTTSFSVIPFSSCPQSFPASGSFQMSQPFSSGGQSIGVSASMSCSCINFFFYEFGFILCLSLCSPVQEALLLCFLLEAL